MTASDHKIIGVKKSKLLIAGALLAVSLALNLIIIGGMVSYKSWRHEHAAGKYDYEKIEKFILRQFPQEQSVEVAGVLERHRGDIVRTYSVYTGYKTELANALRQEQVSRDSLERIAANLRAAQQDVSVVHHAFMVDLSALAPMELRKKLAKSIDRRGPLTSRNHP
ncbi:MAG: hypothetical protein ACON4W_08380 [Parvibaculales bacterium]